LDRLEFARGSADSKWGSVRAAMGHPEPFPVKYVAIGNEDCGKTFYRGKLMDYMCIASFLQYKSKKLCTRQFLTNMPFLVKN
jgi:alpha-L-arabinofuranosidase